MEKKFQLDTSQQEKQQNSCMSYQELLCCGLTKEKSNTLEKEEKDPIGIMMSNPSLKPEELEEKLMNLRQNLLQEEKSVTVESPQKDKKMTSQGKNNTSKNDTQPTNSLETLEVVLTLRGGELKPFWNIHIKERSKNLWLPTKTDCVGLDSKYSNLLFQNFPKEESLFSIIAQSQKTKNLCPIFSPLSMSFRQELMDYENIKQVFKPNSNLNKTSFLRTMRVRLFPTLRQKNILNMLFGVYRRYYNNAKRFSEEHNNTCCFLKVRDGMRKDPKYKLPNKWKQINSMIPERVSRGAIQDFCSALEGNFTKIRNGDITHFEMKSKRKKDLTQTLNITKDRFSVSEKTKNTMFPGTKFRDPTKTYDKTNYGLNIRGSYKKGRTRIKLRDINIEHDCRISYENSRFFLLIPYYKEEIKPIPRHTVISLDSGIRTFQTGYSPEGHTVEICKNPNDKLRKMYNKLDDLNKKYFDTKVNGSFTKKFKEKRTAISKRRRIIFEKIRNIIDNLHWKTIKFLTSNYKDIIISDFRVKELLKLKELRHISKRVLSSLSHYRFRRRLIEKCHCRGNYLCIFDESYTSKTCSECGKINQFLGAKKVFECPYCDYVADRDINAGRNILLKVLDFLNTCVLDSRESLTTLCYTGVK